MTTKTTPHVYDLFDRDALDDAISRRLVRAQSHPELDLSIYNYTALAQYDRSWNPVTLSCRGLVVDRDGFVVARPFQKFFNADEYPGPLPSGPVSVTDKLDGSLGILYRHDATTGIATRGSFTSDQARHATEVYRARYQDSFEPNPAWTYLFEVIYPKNRVVIDYGELDDLVLIGAVDVASGASVPLDVVQAHWPGPSAETLPYTSLHDALHASPRPNREGLVIHFVDADLRVKVKQSAYVEAHRLVTGVSERRVWEELSAGRDIEPWLEAVPDEFYCLVSATRDDLVARHRELRAELDQRFAQLVGSLEEGWTRKDFALAVAQLQHWPLAKGLFTLLDGHDPTELVWRQLRPENHVPFFGRDASD
jgi:RNA ligase